MMDNLSVLTASLLFFLPIAFGIVFIGKSHQIRSFLLVLLSVIILCLLYLSTVGPFTIRTPLAFLGEPLWLSFSQTPTILFLITALTLWLLLFVRQQQRQEELSRFDAVLLAFSLAFGYVAFFSGQFLMRYVSLEIVGLIAALSALDWSEDPFLIGRFRVVFILLRLGDLGLLISILLLRASSGTLNIDEMIKAAVDLPVDQQVWILAGVLMAVAIKLAVWPFSMWLRCADGKKQRPAYWIAAILLPSLGMYLLYRFVPIVQARAVYQTSLLVLAVGVLIVALISRRDKRDQPSRGLMIGNISGAMLFFGAASGSSKALILYSSALIMFRLILILHDREYLRLSPRGAFLLLLIVHAPPLVFLIGEASPLFAVGWVLSTGVLVVALKRQGFLSVGEVDLKRQAGWWDVPMNGSQSEMPMAKLARWVNQNLELGLINRCVTGLTDALRHTAAWLYTHLEQTLDHQWEGVERLMMGISRLTLGQIEQAGADRSDAFFRDLVDRVGEREKWSRQRPFRWDLLWIPLMLAVVLVFLLT
jgi:hypothetical protein